MFIRGLFVFNFHPKRSYTERVEQKDSYALAVNVNMILGVNMEGVLRTGPF